MEGTPSCKIETNVFPYSLPFQIICIWEFNLGKPCGGKTEVISGTYRETYLRTLRKLRNPLGTHWEQGKKQKILSPLAPPKKKKLDCSRVYAEPSDWLHENSLSICHHFSLGLMPVCESPETPSLHDATSHWLVAWKLVAPKVFYFSFF